MKQPGRTSLCAGVLISVAMGGASLAQQGSPQPPPTRVISKIRGDLYKFQNNQHNSWFLVTPEGVVVGDPINAEAAAWLKNEIAQRFKVPVRYLVYSHHHWDHARGARVFDDTAELVGHANMAAAIKDAVENIQAGITRGLDRNKDRKLDRTEAQGGTLRQFDMLDTNKDGALDGSGNHRRCPCTRKHVYRPSNDHARRQEGGVDSSRAESHGRWDGGVFSCGTRGVRR